VDVGHKGSDNICVTRVLDGIEERSTARAVIVENSLLCFEAIIQAKRECKLEDVLVLPEWDVDRLGGVESWHC
jgi:hypothetical protein